MIALKQDNRALNSVIELVRMELYHGIGCGSWGGIINNLDKNNEIITEYLVILT